MAVRWAVQNGNWSNTATWDGGTLPTSADDVYADGKTVTIDQDVTVLSIRNDQRIGGTSGGNFVIGDTLSTYVITSNLLSYGSLNLFTSSFNNKTITINGNIIFNGNFGGTSAFIFSSSSSTLNIIGNISDTTASKVTSGLALVISGVSSIINITGNILSQGAGIISPSLIRVSSILLSFNITGNIETLSSSNCLQIANTITNGINIIGQCKAGTNSCISITADVPITITKTIGGLIKTASGIVSSGTITISEIENTLNGGCGVGQGNIRWANNSIKIIGYRADGTQFILSDGVGDSNFIPNPANVRSGITYNLSQNTGTLVLPTVDNVRKGVVYDNFDKTGTADLTAEDFWTYATRSLTEAPDVPTAQEIADQVWLDEPERLKNVATVETTGDQLAAL
jgi:hypothetical protein